MNSTNQTQPIAKACRNLAAVGPWLMVSAALLAVSLSALGNEGAAGKTIPGYRYGSSRLPSAPFRLQDIETLKATVLFTDTDTHWLRKSRDVLEPHSEEILDTWYGFVGANPHLLQYFSNEEGKPDHNYLARVRARFIQWIYDTADAKFDQHWLDYQYEIGRRHHRTGKNQTDGAQAIEHIPMRYVIALVYPVTATLKPFLARAGHSTVEVDAMHAAWTKSVLMQAILWSYPYVQDGDF